MDEPVNFPIHFNTGSDRAGQAPGASLKGMFRGEEVTLNQAAKSPAGDAAEELSFTGANRSRKDLYNRRVTDGHREKARGAGLAEFYLEKLPDLDERRLRDFYAGIRRTGGSAGELAERAGRAFKEVSHQFAALDFARKRLAEENQDPGLVEAAQKAAETCLARNGPEVRAGLNTSRTAREYEVKGFGELQALRDLYREAVVKAEGLEETFRSICQTHGKEDLTHAVEFLMAAAGSDLRAQEPSGSPARLKSVMDELYCLKVLSCLHRDCSGLLRRMENQHGLKLKTTPGRMMKHLLDFKTNRYLQSRGIVKMVDGFGITDHAAKIDCLRELNHVIFAFPEKTFPDGNTRQHLVTAFREAMDAAIDSELETA